MSSGISWAERPRDFVGVRGPDAEDFLQRMVSNDVAALESGAACDALLLTPKARVIAPLRVLRRDADDFLVLTEPGLGDTLLRHLLRARFAAKAEIEPEEHSSLVVLGGSEGIPAAEYGPDARELLDGKRPGGRPLTAEALERLRIASGAAAWGREIDERVLPAEADLVERAVSLTKGCYPGQEPIARLHYRGHVNRTLRRLEIDGDEPPPYDAELRHGDRVVGRVTSAVRDDGRIVALGYVRTDVPNDAELTLEGGKARLH
ncbi:MAG: folate-binding protein YgfZ [Thermoleophilia bacterium]|nr:folate-binding protein YgfZ [Thermoleophilia bacterium]